MKIPQTAEIPEEKFTRYLLVKREFDDKSKFLNAAGFTLENSRILRQELKMLIGREKAVEERSDEYGTFYTVSGVLAGPTGTSVSMVTVWLRRRSDRGFQFVTLKPLKGK